MTTPSIPPLILQDEAGGTDWEKLYAVLQELVEQLKYPETASPAEVGEAIAAARRVENRTVIYYTRASKRLAVAKELAACLKTSLRLKTKALLTDNTYYRNLPPTKRKAQIELDLMEDQEALNKAVDLVSHWNLYLEAIQRVLESAKHTREDIGRKLKLIQIDRELGTI